MPNQQPTEAMRDQLVLEYFKAMRKEINLRIRNHTTLVTAKVITAGGILAFMLKEGSQLNPTVAVFGVLLVPIVAMLYDVLISNNICVINRMGAFIRDTIEPCVSDIRLWETDYAQKCVGTRCYSYADVIALSLLTLGTIVVALLLVWHTNEHTSVYILWPLVVLGWAATTYHMIRCFLQFRPPETKTDSTKGRDSQDAPK